MRYSLNQILIELGNCMKKSGGIIIIIINLDMILILLLKRSQMNKYVIWGTLFIFQYIFLFHFELLGEFAAKPTKRIPL